MAQRQFDSRRYRQFGEMQQIEGLDSRQGERQMKTYRFDALQKPLEAERQWLLIAASAATLRKRGVDGEVLILSPPETPEGRFAPKRGMWRGNQQRRGLAASAADFVSQTGMFSSAARLIRTIPIGPIGASPMTPGNSLETANSKLD